MWCMDCRYENGCDGATCKYDNEPKEKAEKEQPFDVCEYIRELTNNGYTEKQIEICVEQMSEMYLSTN